ncbi:MAG: hypothetical protein WCL19_04990, partial [Verrucomicrobiota bacterium]
VAGHKGGGSGQGANGFAVVLHCIIFWFSVAACVLAEPVVGTVRSISELASRMPKSLLETFR